jgi:hypothetical protein
MPHKKARHSDPMDLKGAYKLMGTAIQATTGLAAVNAVAGVAKGIKL